MDTYRYGQEDEGSDPEGMDAWAAYDGPSPDVSGDEGPEVTGAVDGESTSTVVELSAYQANVVQQSSETLSTLDGMLARRDFLPGAHPRVCRETGAGPPTD